MILNTIEIPQPPWLPCIDHYDTFHIDDEQIYSRFIMLGILVFMIVVTVGIWNYYDVMWWQDWVYIARTKGILYVYEAPKNAYFPLASLLYIASYTLADSIGLKCIEVYRVITKFFIVIVPGIFIAYLLRRMINTVAAKLWIFGTPFILVLTGLQFDVLVAAFSLVYFIALINRRYILAGIALALATAIKPVAISLALLAFLYIDKFRDLTKLSKLFVSLIAVLSAIVLPFYLTTPKEFLSKALLFHSHRFPQELSVWAIPVILYGGNAFAAEWLRWAWIPFLLVTLTATIVFSYKFRHRIRSSVSAMAIVATLIMLELIVFNKVGGPNYLVWAYPFLLIAIGLSSGYESRDGVKLVFIYNAVVVLVASLYLFLYYIPRAVLGYYMLIVEDLGYWNARYLYLANYGGSLAEFASTSLDLTTLSKEQLETFKFIIKVDPEIMLLRIAILNIALTYMIVHLIKKLSGYASR